MRFSRTAWLILAMGILLIAFISLYMLYLQERHAQEQINESLTLAQNTLTKLASENSELESTLAEGEAKLKQAISRLEQAQASFPTSVDSIEIEEQFFKLADEWDLEIIRLTSSEPGNEKVEDVTYFVTTFNAEVKGEVRNILNFINTMTTREDFKTFKVKLVDISVPTPLSELEKADKTEEELEDLEPPGAIIEIVIYGYKGG